MRVLLVGSYYAPVVGGIETHMQQIAEGLLAQHIDVRIICLNTSPNGTERFAEEETLGGIKVWRIVNGLFIKRAIQDYEPNVAHFHGFSRPLLLRGMMALKNVPWVITPHSGIHGRRIDLHRWRRISKDLFDKTGGRILVKRAKKIIALTPVEANVLLSLGVKSNRITVLPNMVTLDSVPDEYSAQGVERRFLSLARMDPRKRIGDIIEAMTINPTALGGLDVAGPDAGDETHLRKLASRLPPDKVRFLGPIKGPAKTILLKNARALVIPSSFEGMSISALEAIACGTPVIATPEGSVGIPEEAVCPFPLGDTRALHKILLSFGRNEVEHYWRKQATSAQWVACTSAQYISRLIELYQEVSL